MFEMNKKLRKILIFCWHLKTRIRFQYMDTRIRSRIIKMSRIWNNKCSSPFQIFMLDIWASKSLDPTV